MSTEEEFLGNESGLARRCQSMITGMPEFFQREDRLPSPFLVRAKTVWLSSLFPIVFVLFSFSFCLRVQFFRSILAVPTFASALCIYK